MTAQDWNAFLGMLDERERVMAQMIMARIVTVMENHRSNNLSDIQRIEREITALKKQVREIRDRSEAHG